MAEEDDEVLLDEEGVQAGWKEEVCQGRCLQGEQEYDEGSFCPAFTLPCTQFSYSL